MFKRTQLSGALVPSKQFAGFFFAACLLAVCLFGSAIAQTINQSQAMGDLDIQIPTLGNTWEIWSESKMKVTAGTAARSLDGRLKISRSNKKTIKTGKVSEVLAGRPDLWQIRLFPYSDIVLEPSGKGDILTIEKGFVRISATGQQGMAGFKKLDREFEEHFVVRAQNYTILPERRSHFYMKAIPQKGIWIKVVSGNILIETPQNRVLALASLGEWQSISESDLGLKSLRAIDLADFTENLRRAGDLGDFGAAEKSQKMWLNENLPNILDRFMSDGRAIEAYQIVESNIAANLLPKPELKLKKAIILAALGFEERAEVLLLENHQDFPSHSATIITLAELQLKLDKLENAEQLVLKNWDLFTAEEEAKAHLVLGLIAEKRNALPQAEVHMTFAQWSEKLCCARAGKMFEVLETASRLRPLRLIVPLSLQYDVSQLPAAAFSDTETTGVDPESKFGLSLGAGLIASVKLHGFAEQDSSSGSFDVTSYGNYHFAESQRAIDLLFLQGMYQWQTRTTTPAIKLGLGVSALAVGLKFYKLSVPLSSQFGLFHLGLEYSLPVPLKTRHELAFKEKFRVPLYPIFLSDSTGTHNFLISISATQAKLLESTNAGAETAEPGNAQGFQWSLKLEPLYTFRPSLRVSGTAGMGLTLNNRDNGRVMEAALKFTCDYALHPTLRLNAESNLVNTFVLEKDNSSGRNNRTASFVSSAIWSY